jgi:hypothetical protein
MQAQAPSGQGSIAQQPPPPDQEPNTPASKRRRQSPRSAKSSPEDADSSRNGPSASDSGTATLKKPAPSKRGSSRGSDMQRSPTPDETGAIKYTRTGRVSKATKGRRVHHCDECGKVCLYPAGFSWTGEPAGAPAPDSVQYQGCGGADHAARRRAMSRT